jgi:hypothetical protein
MNAESSGPRRAEEAKLRAGDSDADREDAQFPLDDTDEFETDEHVSSTANPKNCHSLMAVNQKGAR